MRRGRTLIFVLIIEVVSLSLGGLFIREYLAKDAPQERGELSQRLDDLALSIQTTSDSINQIENEIIQTRLLVDDLEQKKLLYEQIVDLNNEQVEAVAFLINQQQEEENKRSLWINALIGLVTNILVAAVGMYAEYKVGFIRKWLTKDVR